VLLPAWLNFGAFARLSDEIEGLIHISEISEKRIEHPREVLKEGESVTLRIIKIDPDNHRIGLSMRKVESMAYADMDWQTLLDEMESEDEEETNIILEEDVKPEETSSIPDEEVQRPFDHVWRPPQGQRFPRQERRSSKIQGLLDRKPA